MESFLTSAGYGALILFGFLEACCVPISSEVTFGFAGVLAYQGTSACRCDHHRLAGRARRVVHVLRRGPLGRPSAGGQGRPVRADHPLGRGPGRTVPGRAWFLGHPGGADDPVVRAFASIVAGLTEMPLARFAVLSAIGTVIYVLRSRPSVTQWAVLGTVSPMTSRSPGTSSSSCCCSHRRLRVHPAACVPPGGGRGGGGTRAARGGTGGRAAARGTGPGRPPQAAAPPDENLPKADGRTGADHG